MEEDPLEPIARECKITYSQEEKLKKCGFALELEENEEEDPVEVTGIVMVSLAESNEESDVFHTPPEQYRSQSMSGSEDQGPVKTEVVLGNDVGGFTQAEKAVDLGKDSVNFAEPIVIETENVEIEETEVVNLVVEESCEEMEVRVSENTKNVEGANSGGELLNSFEENEGMSVLQQALNDVKTIMDLLVAADQFFGESATDTDYLKAAKECGLTFDRPRWWPPEGFDDQVTDNI